MVRAKERECQYHSFDVDTAIVEVAAEIWKNWHMPDDWRNEKNTNCRREDAQ